MKTESTLDLTSETIKVTINDEVVHEDTRPAPAEILSVGFSHPQGPTVPAAFAAIQAASEAFGGLLDAGAGVIDGFLDAVNPLDFRYSVPDIGARFGNSGAYTGGYVGGVGLGIVGSFAVGNVAAGAGAAGKLALAAKAYTVFDTGATVAQVGAAAANVAQTRSFGLADAATFAPLAGFAGGLALRKLAASGAAKEIGDFDTYVSASLYRSGNNIEIGVPGSGSYIGGLYNPGSNSLHIGNVFVEEAARGRGVSTALYARLLEEAGDVRKVTGQASGLNLSAFAKGGAAATPRAMTLMKFGFSVHRAEVDSNPAGGILITLISETPL